MKVKDLKPYKKNAKKHPKKQIERIANSIEMFGFNDPIAIWKVVDKYMKNRPMKGQLSF